MKGSSVKKGTGIYVLAASIQAVSKERMPKSCHMHTDLVCTSCFQPQRNKRPFRRTAKCMIVCDGRFGKCFQITKFCFRTCSIRPGCVKVGYAALTACIFNGLQGSCIIGKEIVCQLFSLSAGR